MKILAFLLIFCLGFSIQKVVGQTADNQTWMAPISTAYIVDGADTIYCMDLPLITIFAYRSFVTDDDRFNYMR